ncbi:hypothetical protein F3Y22_tig00008013pilonHSYRG00302 [Hibiscus syriacus]|uniref:Uncharacterized protein n=1 Tax=Hibiscus syriacus TaxID=106335 RepID=A0A6A3CBB1_HIBSY|nr:hypothetical protein F3Y22_tig00008013pilonHSYRG00302 [Hibiscus syriacus]
MWTSNELKPYASSLLNSFNNLRVSTSAIIYLPPEFQTWMRPVESHSFASALEQIPSDFENPTSHDHRVTEGLRRRPQSHSSSCALSVLSLSHVVEPSIECPLFEPVFPRSCLSKQIVAPGLSPNNLSLQVLFHALNFRPFHVSSAGGHFLTESYVFSPRIPITTPFLANGVICTIEGTMVAATAAAHVLAKQ